MLVIVLRNISFKFNCDRSFFNCND